MASRVTINLRGRPWKKPAPSRLIQRIHRAERVERLKVQVFRRLGGRRCRAEPGCRGLYPQVHHKKGRTWDARAVNEETRWKRYLQEIEAGVPLEVWCDHHNGRDGQRRRGKRRW